MRGDEERVVTAYASWLERNGWTVAREVEFVAIYAERGEEKLYAEAKGRTAAIGLDVLPASARERGAPPLHRIKTGNPTRLTCVDDQRRDSMDMHSALSSRAY